MKGFDNHLPITDALVADHGLTPDEYARVLDVLGRTPTLTELGIFSVMWSEHCSYKSSRKHLRRLPTSGPRVLQGPGENAGVVDVGDGWVSRSRWRATTTRASSSPTRARPRASAASCATCSPWAPAPSPAGCAALRPRRTTRARAPRQGRGRRHRQLRQLHGRAHGRRRGHLRPELRRQHPRQRLQPRAAARRPHLPRLRHRSRQPGHLCRRQDGPRRHPRRDDGVGTPSTRAPSRSARPCRSATRSSEKLLLEACLELMSRRTWSSASRTWARRG
jgi:hypothetical protein